MLRIANGFTRLSDALLYTRGSQIQEGMTDNVNFVKPKPTLAELQGALAAFNDALMKCKSGDRLEIAIKNQKRQQLIDLLHLLGDYVLFQSNGDAVIAVSSGFRIAKSPAPRPPLQKPAFYTVENGINPNELISKGPRVPNSVSYNHQYADDEQMAASLWQSVPNSKSTCVLTNMSSGVFYNCRLEVLGVKGQVVYSDIQRIRVL